jgi:hypothetical protein
MKYQALSLKIKRNLSIHTLKKREDYFCNRPCRPIGF